MPQPVARAHAQGKQRTPYTYKNMPSKPSYQATGIVIGRTNFGEADRVVRFLTPDQGKLSAVAKGVRRIKSRSGGHLELFGEVSLMLHAGRGSLETITSARLAWYPHQLAADYARMQLAFTMAAMANHIAQERQPQPELYRHLSEALHAVDAGASGSLPELWYKLRLLQIAGLRPELGACVVCGRHDEATSYRIDPARGGITCDADSDPLSRPIDAQTIKLWRLLCDYPYATISQISNAPALAAASLAAANEFCEHHLGKSF